MTDNLIIGLVVALIIGLLSFVLAKVKPRSQGGRVAISPSAVIPAVGLFGLGIAALCLYASVSSRALPPLVLAVGFAMLGALLTNNIRPVFTVWCDATGVSGPDSLLFAPKRESIAWADVRRIGPSWTGSLFIESHAGQRIYFSTAHIGHQWLFEEVWRRRPDLKNS